MVKKLSYLFCITIIIFSRNNAMTIEPVQQYRLSDACIIIYNAAFELQIVPSQCVDDVIQEVKRTNALSDMTNMQSINDVYLSNGGTFLVVTQNNILAGMGAIKNLNDGNCELTRMFFAPEFRGIGLGSQLIQKLISFAQASGYQKIRLNIWNPETQERAINFFRKFGFYNIAPYKICAGKIFMEKSLLYYG